MMHSTTALDYPPLGEKKKSPFGAPCQTFSMLIIANHLFNTLKLENLVLVLGVTEFRKLSQGA